VTVAAEGGQVVTGWIRRLLDERRGRKLSERLVDEERKNMKHPAEIVLRAMMAGHELKVGDLVYKLEGGVRLLVKRIGSSKSELGPGKVMVVKSEPWISADIRVSQFLSMCNQIPRDDLFILGANTSLTEINRRGGPSGLSRSR